ncbi:MAG: ribosomal protein S18-alanine N-acetyltransferase [Kofleriaceae bacterium]
MIIVAATAADLDAIDEIEQHSFPEPWPRSTFEAELTRDYARVDVARESAGAGRVIGFCNYWLVAAGAEGTDRAGGEVHILAIATHPDRRRGGIAGRLLDHALAAGREVGATVATLEVRRGNRPAIALYERAGFRTVHVRPRYYQSDGEDALIMLADLASKLT